MTFDGRSNQRRRDRRVLSQRQAQGLLHGILAVAGRQLQDLEIFPGCHARTVRGEQLIVGHAKMAGRKQVLVVLVVLESARLANQRIDHMAVVDRVLAAARQPRHLLNQNVCVPDLDEVRVDHHVHLVPNQPTGNGVRVALDLNGAAAADPDARHALAVIELRRRQLAETSLLLGKLVGSRGIALVDQGLQELFVLLTAGEVAAAAQQERLVDHGLQMAMRRFHVAVLMRRSGVDPLGLDLIVVHQVAVTAAKLPVFREVVDRRAEAVATMPGGHAAQLPKRLLHSAADRFERLAETDRDEFPVGVRQREVIEQVGEGLAGDRDAQRVHAREVRGRQAAGIVDLRKHHFLARPLGAAPLTHAALEGPPLRLREPAGILLLEPAE